MLANKNVLITAGPTREAIDPVRYLSNHSSGQMGYALAVAASKQGASVTLISGPTALAKPKGIHVIDVISAEEMFTAVMQHIAEQDIFIAAAAVADYRPVTFAAEKIKKSPQALTLTLEPTQDILAAAGTCKPKPFVVGFAAETENVLDNARKKLQQKNCDIMIANQVGEQQGFEQAENEVTLLAMDTEPLPFPKQPKQTLAEALITEIDRRYF